MKKNTLKLTESELHQVITESLRNVLNEIADTPEGKERFMQGLYQRNNMFGPSYNSDKSNEYWNYIDNHRQQFPEGEYEFYKYQSKHDDVRQNLNYRIYGDCHFKYCTPQFVNKMVDCLIDVFGEEVCQTLLKL